MDNLDHLEWMGRFIGRLHAVGVCKTFQHRPQLDIKSYGEDSYHFLIAQDFIPPSIKDTFCQTVETLLQRITQTFQKVGQVDSIRLHGDCHAGNILWNERGPQIVDLDDCLMGPAVQDIWMLLSGNPAQVEIQLERILRGYREFYDFNRRELQLIESLRALRLLRYSAWLAKRWEDPTFPLNFPWFNTLHYWQEHLRNLNEQSTLIAY